MRKAPALFRNAPTLLLLVYAISVSVKMMFASDVPTPSVYFDEYIYSTMARAAVHFDLPGLLRYGGREYYPPLYPLLLSPAYLFQNMHTSYFVMKLINSILISTIVIPAWMLLRKFLGTTESAIFTLAVSFLPPVSIYPCFILSENLFLPLFLLAIVLEVETVVAPRKIKSMLLGLVIALCYLTRYNGILLFVPFVIVMFAKSVIDRAGKVFTNPSKTDLALSFLNLMKKQSTVLLAFCLGVAPYVFARVWQYGATLSVAVGANVSYSSTLFVFPVLSEQIVAGFVEWTILHFNYGVLTSAVFLFSTSLVALIDRHLDNGHRLSLLSLAFISSYLVLVVMASAVNLAYSAQYPWLYISGRYVDPAIPGLVLIGLVGLKQAKIRSTHLSLILAFLLISSISILSFPQIWRLVTPSQSIGINYLWLAYYENPNGLWFSGWLLLLCFLPAAFLSIRRVRWDSRIVGACIVLLFLIGSVGAAGLVQWSANYSQHEIYVADWVVTHDIRNATILVDDASQIPRYRLFYGLDFWVWERHILLRFGNVSEVCTANYFLSSASYNLPVLGSYATNGTQFFIYQASGQCSWT